MRAKHVVVGTRVRILVGAHTNKVGVIDSIKDVGLGSGVTIAVRPDGFDLSLLYKSCELSRFDEPYRARLLAGVRNV